VCKDKDLECNAEYFAALNECNTLRSVFMCEAGCGPSEANKNEFPGYVHEAAPKNDWPAFCFYYSDGKKAAAGHVLQYNCSASSDQVQRVCPCESAPGVGSQAEQLDALSKQQTKTYQGDGSGDNDA
jgi:hypothetical protein